MAVYEATHMAAISLPFGANHLPLEVLPWLERFERIYLWMDADEVGRTAAEKFAQKLGVRRTFIVNTTREDPKGPKDANDALRAGHDLLKYIKEARPLVQENILTFKHIKEDVIKRIINYEQNKGVLSSFEWFNKKIKGFRKGEITVLTGGTGSGKTTLLSQLSLDFMERGVPTLWGSFEIRNEILASTMLMQFARKDLVREPTSIELYARDFESLPLYFLKFYGSTPVDQMLNTLDYAVYAYDIAHIVIDNLQFMLSGQARGVDKFELQDTLISRLRDFATTHKIHITIVIHPKKVDEDHQDLSISSVFGTAKATQEADNIFILQNRYKYRLVDVRKNRFDGETGRVGLGYNKNTKRFCELTEQEVEHLNKSQKTVEDIFEERAMNDIPVASTEEVKNGTKATAVLNEHQKIEKLVEQDINYYGSIAQKTVKQASNILLEAAKSIKKTGDIIPDITYDEYRPDEVIEQEVDKEALKKIIGGFSFSSSKDQQKPLEPQKIVEKESQQPPEPAEVPKTFNLGSEPQKPLEPLVVPNKIIENSNEKPSEAPEPEESLPVIGYPDWMEKTVKEPPKPSAKVAKKPNYNTEARTYKSTDKKEKPTFGETYSSVTKTERKRLFEVLKSNGYLTTKAKGKYGRTTSTTTSSSGRSSGSDRP
eukprot:TRINITY_DN88208_c1_g1_i1.p1 TRINITY_DN88208_c1_g1~~TRINITY_DN88208_c1_g1_i1.p1  ORF type:complete len:655 (-),score=104.66 TRINITY_DN88208_c1_g1_i1:1386-3350(-)